MPSETALTGRIGTPVIGAVLLALSGCAMEPLQPPVRYQEDFAGSPTPFVLSHRVSDGQIDVLLQPGWCRQIAIGAGVPPRVVNTYRCRYSTANVTVGFILGQLGSWSGVTGPGGDVTLSIPDDQAIGMSPEEVVTFYIGNRAVSRASLAPLVIAAANRIASLAQSAPLPPPPPLPPTPVPLPLPQQVQPAEPAPPPAAATRRNVDPLDALVLTAGICAVKQWASGKCEEFVAQFLGNDAAAATCSAAQEYLKNGTFSGLDTTLDVMKSKAARADDVWAALIAGADLLGCVNEYLPKVTETQ